MIAHFSFFGNSSENALAFIINRRKIYMKNVHSINLIALFGIFFTYIARMSVCCSFRLLFISHVHFVRSNLIAATPSTSPPYESVLIPRSLNMRSECFCSVIKKYEPTMSLSATKNSFLPPRNSNENRLKMCKAHYCKPLSAQQKHTTEPHSKYKLITAGWMCRNIWRTSQRETWNDLKKHFAVCGGYAEREFELVCRVDGWCALFPSAARWLLLSCFCCRKFLFIAEHKSKSYLAEPEQKSHSI